MSHFTVGVICKDFNDYENLLAPYQENNMGDCPEEYLKFNSVTEEEKQIYENEKAERFVTSNGDYIHPYDSCFDVEITREEYKRLDKQNVRGLSSRYGKSETTYFKKDYSLLQGELREVPYKEIYQTFEQYMEDCGGYEFDEEMNDYGYWENLNAKWDWYEVGGRWNKCIPLKNNEKCNIAKLKDINFGIDQKKYDEEKRFWEIIVEEQPLNDGEEEPFNFYKKEYYLARYKDKNDYAIKNSVFNTFALITPDGKWYEKGKMGWFAFDNSTQETIKSFEDNFNEIVNKEEYQDYYFVLVDCHI